MTPSLQECQRVVIPAGPSRLLQDPRGPRASTQADGSALKVKSTWKVSGLVWVLTAADVLKSRLQPDVLLPSSASLPPSLRLYIMFPPTNSWELICLYITLHYPRRLRLTALSKQRETEQPGARSSEERGAASGGSTDDWTRLKKKQNQKQLRRRHMERSRFGCIDKKKTQNTFRCSLFSSSCWRPGCTERMLGGRTCDLSEKLSPPSPPNISQHLF